ncbi:MAG: hypothetical protein ACRED0_08770 [Gammaproteobacteria bacterium]
MRSSKATAAAYCKKRRRVSDTERFHPCGQSYALLFRASKLVVLNDGKIGMSMKQLKNPKVVEAFRGSLKQDEAGCTREFPANPKGSGVVWNNHCCGVDVLPISLLLIPSGS